MIRLKNRVVFIWEWLRDASQWIFRYERRVSEYRPTILNQGKSYAAGPIRVHYDVRMPNGATQTRHVSSKYGNIWYWPDGTQIDWHVSARLAKLVGADKPESAERLAVVRLNEIREYNAMVAELDKAEEDSK